MNRILTFAALTAFAAPLLASAQSEDSRFRRPPGPSLPPRPPLIWLQPQAKLEPMQLQSADIDIRVIGHAATTRMELAFFNPNHRVIEGELLFPLGEGESVSGYELDVNGRMRSAVSVPKETGREIFEDIVRRGVDPGLAELTKGNVFRTRLYPIPANGIKKVAITFQTELNDTADGFRYLLPLGWKDKVKSFHARVEVVKQEVAPLNKTDEGEALTFEKWRDAWIAELKKEDFAPEKPLVFTVPKQAGQPEMFLTPDRLDPATGWFTLRVNPEIPAAPAAAMPHRVALFYDASGSAVKRDRKREEAFLTAWLKSAGTITIDLIAFRNEAEPVRTIEIKDGAEAPLLEALRALPLDGGTSLGAVDVNAAPQAEAALLITDGQSNFSSAEPRLTRQDGKNIPVFTVHAAQAADHPALERAARRTGARTVNLLTLSDADAVNAMKGAPFQFLGAKVLSGEATELAPSLPVAVTRGFSLAGKYRGKTEIELSFGYGGKASVTRKVTLDPATALEPERSGFVRKLWAQKRIADLLPDGAKNETLIAQIGKENGVITPFNSLLVLELIEDYVRWEIEPPEEDLRQEWQKALAQHKKIERRQNAAEKSHLDKVAKQWREFLEWHGKKHPWLETVLQPAADEELKRLSLIVAQGKEKSAGLNGADVEQARVIAGKAQDLKKRWLKEGAADETRAEWQKQAVALMLELDALRQRRIAAFPEDIANYDPPQIPQTFGGSTTGRRGEDRSAAPRAPPPPAAAAPVDAAKADLEEKSAADPFSAPDDAGRPEGGERESRSRGAVAAKTAKSPAAGEDQESTVAMESSIEVKPWNPDTPYLKKMRAAADAYAAYLEERTANAASSAFFLDCADFFREEKKDERLALRVVSNLAEMEYESAPLLRILAYRLQQFGRHDLAIPLFEEVLKMRGEEPQSRRDLALALARQPQPDIKRAAELLWETVRRPWDDRFEGIAIIALHELNALLAACPPEAKPDPAALGIPAPLIGLPAADLRVVLTWDADATDIDLWVTDPAGETVMYNMNRSKTGGRISNDFTGGYGPEVFTITRALPGTYTVHVNYYGNRQQKFAGATTIQVEFQTGFGTRLAKTQAITRRLTDAKDVIEAGKFVFRPLLAKEG